jgi:hypothetical protein
MSATKTEECPPIHLMLLASHLDLTTKTASDRRFFLVNKTVRCSNF